MYDYSELPTLVLNKIFGYLNVNGRIKCKSICRTWRKEIELLENQKDTLVLHVGRYLWNLKWTNNGGLMKYENSFEMKHLTFLKSPLIKLLLKKTKKVAITMYHNLLYAEIELSDLSPYLSLFNHLEEIEIVNFNLKGAQTFDMPKLKHLVIKGSSVGKLVLRCPSLETLFWDNKVEELQFYRVKKLKRLTCFGWPKYVMSDDKLKGLEYLSLYTIRDERLSDRMLEYMPKLKRFVLYSYYSQANLLTIQKQKQRLGMRELEILVSGFGAPIEVALERNPSDFVALTTDKNLGELFDNYTKLEENFPMKFSLDYAALFDKFKILPANFFERFPMPFTVEISRVANYTHLFEFLRCYPFIQQLKLHFSKVDQANSILDWIHQQQPSLSELILVEKCPLNLIDIRLSFLKLINPVCLHLESTRLPVEFLRKVAAESGSLFRYFAFREILTSHRLSIYILLNQIALVDASCGQVPQNAHRFKTIEPLISFLKTDPHLRTFVI